jgi:hypothetical protein
MNKFSKYKSANKSTKCHKFVRKTFAIPQALTKIVNNNWLIDGNDMLPESTINENRECWYKSYNNVLQGKAAGVDIGVLSQALFIYRSLLINTKDVFACYKIAAKDLEYLEQPLIRMHNQYNIDRKIYFLAGESEVVQQLLDLVLDAIGNLTGHGYDMYVVDFLSRCINKAKLIP